MQDESLARIHYGSMEQMLGEQIALVPQIPMSHRPVPTNPHLHTRGSCRRVRPRALQRRLSIRTIRREPSGRLAVWAARPVYVLLGAVRERTGGDYRRSQRAVSQGLCTTADRDRHVSAGSHRGMATVLEHTTRHQSDRVRNGKRWPRARRRAADHGKKSERSSSTVRLNIRRP